MAEYHRHAKHHRDRGQSVHLCRTSLLATNAAGNATNFDKTNNYTWVLASASNGIVGFNASDFVVNTSAFSNDFAGGSFAVQLNGNDLDLVYTSSVPEPISLSAVFVGTLALSARRRGGCRRQ